MMLAEELTRERTPLPTCDPGHRLRPEVASREKVRITWTADAMPVTGLANMFRRHDPQRGPFHFL